MILLVGSLKGGVGKTTLAMALGSYLSQRGREVEILDLQETGALQSLFEEEQKEKQPFPIQVKGLSKDLRELLPENLLLRKKEEKVTLIDLPTFPTMDFKKLIELSDLILIPYDYTELTLRSTLVFVNYLKLNEAKCRIYFVRWNIDKSRTFKNQIPVDLELRRHGRILMDQVTRNVALAQVGLSGLDVSQRAAVARSFNEVSEYLGIYDEL